MESAVSGTDNVANVLNCSAMVAGDRRVGMGGSIGPAIWAGQILDVAE